MCTSAIHAKISTNARSATIFSLKTLSFIFKTRHIEHGWSLIFNGPSACLGPGAGANVDTTRQASGYALKNIVTSVVRR